MSLKAISDSCPNWHWLTVNFNNIGEECTEILARMCTYKELSRTYKCNFAFGNHLSAANYYTFVGKAMFEDTIGMPTEIVQRWCELMSHENRKATRTQTFS